MPAIQFFMGTMASSFHGELRFLKFFKSKIKKFTIKTYQPIILLYIKIYILKHIVTIYIQFMIIVNFLIYSYKKSERKEICWSFSFYKINDWQLQTCRSFSFCENNVASQPTVFTMERNMPVIQFLRSLYIERLPGSCADTVIRKSIGLKQPTRMLYGVKSCNWDIPEIY